MSKNKIVSKEQDFDQDHDFGHERDYEQEWTYEQEQEPYAPAHNEAFLWRGAWAVSYLVTFAF